MFGSINQVHIVLLWILFVALITIFIVYRIWAKEVLLGNEIDFISAFLNKKNAAIEKNDVKFSIHLYIGMLVCCPLALGLGGYFFSKKAIVGILFAAAGLLLPDGVLMFLKQRESKRFEEKYERSLEQLASNLRSEASIMRAVKEVSENRFIYEPIRVRYQKMYADLTMGIPVKDAFYRFAESTDSDDAKDVALAIEIQDELGGKEAEVILSIAKDIHDRIMLRKEVRSMFAGTAYMVWVMDFLPLFIVLMLTFTNDLYTGYYFKGMNIAIYCGIIGLCLLGSLINHRKLRKVLSAI